MTARIADRLGAAREHAFVGRRSELDLFGAALAADVLPFSVLFVFGPGGVGKTTLLRRFGNVARAAGLPVLALDARDLDLRDPADARAALRSRLEPARDQPGRQVVLLDTYELIGPLDPGVRQELLPELPAQTLVVLAGRDAPAPAWRTDPGWRDLLRVLPLRNLTPQESLAYLSRMGVPAPELAAVVDLTHGHPLALAVVGDEARAGRPAADLRQAPDVLAVLLRTLLENVPGPRHRAALEACALVRALTEPLLAEMLATSTDVGPGHDAPEAGSAADGPDVTALFEWLRGLSLVESGPAGLSPHDLARDLLAADLRWRDPGRYAALHERARRHYLRRVASPEESEQRAGLADLLYLHRDSPVLGPYLRTPDASAGLRSDRLRDGDLPSLRALVERHEGSRSADLAAHWLTRQPAGARVVRDEGRAPVGLLLLLALDEVAAGERDGDPAVAAAWRHLDRRAPLRPGERATLARFWLAADTYQDVSPVQGMLAVELTRHYLGSPTPAVTLLPFARPQAWEAFCAYADQHRAPDADFTVDGRPFTVYSHDWRRVPPAAWVALLGERELSTSPLTLAPLERADAVLVLSAPEFADRLRAALRDLARPDRLRQNPLLRSRVVSARVSTDAGPAERAAALRAAVQDAAAVLKASPRDAAAFRALHRAYLQPAPSHEKAAELLGLPSSTFRRHLAAGVARLTEILWQQELDT